MSLTIFSLNIEGHHHLEAIAHFLGDHSFDVMCLQEVFAVDLPILERAFGAKALYLPLSKVVAENRYNVDPLGKWGIATFSKYPLIKHQTQLYKGDPAVLPVFEDGNPNSTNRGLIATTLEKAGQQFTLVNTHFTWTPDGQANADQRRDVPVFLSQLAEIGELVMMGDLNSPRGRETWEKFAALYHDNIPLEVTTTLDPELFRVKNLQIVIDGLFSTPKYRVTNVKILTGLSDHCGVTAEITVQI